MKWGEFITIVSGLPVIESESLLAGVSDPAPFKVQISRWQKVGKLIQLKRGVYVLPKAYRKMEIYEPFIAALLKKPSYISLEKALEHHSLIPEAVPIYTSVTTKRPGKIACEIGIFDYRHIKSSLFWGYTSVTVNKQTAFIATPEKALLDFFYLKGMRISAGLLKEMRLQNVENVNLDRLFESAKKFKSPGILRVAGIIKKYITTYKEEETIL